MSGCFFLKHGVEWNYWQIWHKLSVSPTSVSDKPFTLQELWRKWVACFVWHFADSDKEEEMCRMRAMHKQQREHTQKAFDDFKLQVENSSSKMYQDMKLQVILHHCHLSPCTLCLPPFNSLTLSDLNPFLKFLHCCKMYKICYKIHATLPTSP